MNEFGTSDEGKSEGEEVKDNEERDYQ